MKTQSVSQHIFRSVAQTLLVRAPVIACEVYRMSLDSLAVFQRRLTELKLSPFTNSFTERGWDSMGAFAFSCAHAPGSSDDTSFINEVVVPILGDPAHVLKPQLRRLFFEAYTMAAIDVQRRASPSDEVDKPKKLPAPERLSRLRVMRARLVGLKIEDDLEPADALVDKYNAMKEDGVLRWVPWEELTAREDEVRNVKKLKEFHTTPDGFLKTIERDLEDPADIASDLKLKTALQRRGIAMELAQLISFEMHDKYVAWLFKEMSRRAMQGFHSVSTNQILEVDKEVFIKLADQTRAGLDLNVDGTFVLNALLDTIIIDPRINLLIAPRQKPVGGQGSPSYHPQGVHFEMPAKQASGKGKVPKGKGKGLKGKGKRPAKDSQILPKDLKEAKGDMVGLYNGKRICFAYNLQGCDLPVNAAGECSKGLHVCSRKDCGGNHPQHYESCPKLSRKRK